LKLGEREIKEKVGVGSSSTTFNRGSRAQFMYEGFQAVPSLSSGKGKLVRR
jgi:hypothetical protein